MSEKDAVIRQRLIELEKKHAKALRKLERAERNKQRRQTFYGFSVQDENTGSITNQSTSSILLSQEEDNSPNVKRPSCFSAHKKGHCKTVTFKETVYTDHRQLFSEKYQNESVAVYVSGSKITSGRKPASIGSCTQQDKPKCHVNTLWSDVERDNKNPDTLDRNATISANDSRVLSDDKKNVDDNVVTAEKQDNHCNQTQELEDQAIKICQAEDVSALSTRSQEIEDLCHEDCFDNSESKCTAKKIKDQNSPNITQESLDLLKGTISLNKTDGYQNKETNELHVSPVSQKLKNAPSENWHWVQLFEEDFPRRSPRLRSMPNFGSQGVTSQDGNVTQPKKSKAKKSRTQKDNAQSSGDEMLKSNMADTALHDGLSEERIGDGLVFPRPSLEYTKPGGPLGVVVDFALPDKEFVKLKLAKIKSALSAERANKEVNDKVGGTAEKAVNEIEGESKLPDSKLMNEQQKDNAEETKKQHVEAERDFKLPYSKTGQETKQECSVLLTQSSSSLQACSVDSNTEFKSKERETFSSTSTIIEENRTDIVTELSSAVSLECFKQSGCHETGSFSLGHKQLDLQSQTIATENEHIACVSPSQQLQEDKGKETCALCLMEPSHCNCSKSEIVNGTSLVHDNPQADGFKKKNGHSPVNERDQPCSECNRTVNQAGVVNIDGVQDKIVQVKNNSATGIYDRTEFPNQKESNDATLKTSLINKTGSPAISFDSAAEVILSNPEKRNNQEELFGLAEGTSSPPDPEPRVGDQGTPYGKMKEPLEISQVSCMMALEDHLDFSPVLMTACLQHCMNGEDNKVRSVSLSSYEASSEKDASSLLQKKRDALVVCLAHLVVIWTIVPGLQWTVLHKWSLPLDGEEEFVSAQFVPVKSHVVLLVGGNFCKGNGRILGYSEEGDYSLDLVGDNEKNNHLFSAMCLLQDALEHKVDKDVEFIIGCRNSHKVTLTKWSLDSYCLLVEGSQSFPPICSDSQLSSLQPVCGSHCLVLGTTDDSLFLWNHRSCQQLRSISLVTLGLGCLYCLKAVTQRGLIFLIMASNSAQKRDFVNTNADACSLFALNPKTSKLVCLEGFRLPERVNIVDTNGHYIAAGSQGRGEVNMWNITNSQRHATLHVFQDEVSSIGFHQDRSLIAFGSTSGCVHLFSLR